MCHDYSMSGSHYIFLDQQLKEFGFMETKFDSMALFVFHDFHRLSAQR